MSNVILSMPRCGSAWLASYFGYLHDPLVHTTWDNHQKFNVQHSIMEYDAEAFEYYVSWLSAS